MCFSINIRLSEKSIIRKPPCKNFFGWSVLHCIHSFSNRYCVLILLVMFQTHSLRTCVETLAWALWWPLSTRLSMFGKITKWTNAHVHKAQVHREFGLHRDILACTTALYSTVIQGYFQVWIPAGGSGSRPILPLIMFSVSIATLDINYSKKMQLV